ncbi:MAG: hypothetical protein ACREQT_03590, partial [Candidatus Binataceae bacterium]
MEGSVYLKAQQEWNERYADLVLGKRNWQNTAAFMMAIMGGCNEPITCYKQTPAIRRRALD